MFVAWVDAEGRLFRVIQDGTSQDDRAHSVLQQPDGHVVVAGVTDGDFLAPLSGPRPAQLFLVAYDTAGDRLWVVQYRPGGADVISAVLTPAANGSGEFYVAGVYERTTALGSSYVLKYAANGTQLWETLIGQPPDNGDYRVHALAADHTGLLFVAGEADSSLKGEPFIGNGQNCLLLKLDSATGDILDVALQATSSGRQSCRHLALDTAHHALIAAGIVTLGNSDDAFVANYSVP